MAGGAVSSSSRKLSRASPLLPRRAGSTMRITSLAQQDPNERKNNGVRSLEYGWQYRGDWLLIGAQCSGEAAFFDTCSEEKFIAEHYRGYSIQRAGGTVEYHVEHPQWRVWPASSYLAEEDLSSFYDRVSCLP